METAVFSAAGWHLVHFCVPHCTLLNEVSHFYRCNLLYLFIFIAVISDLDVVHIQSEPIVFCLLLLLID